jgi:hypothetical protein
MPSVGQRKRNQKIKSLAKAERVRVERENPAGAAPKAPVKRPRQTRDEARETGLGWLLAKKRITPDQARAGARYGELFRAASIGGGEPLRSCLDDSVRGSGGTGQGAADSAAINMAWIADATAALTAARHAVGFHEGMVTALDLICGRGLRPRDISQLTREVDQIETALRLALDLLIGHFQRIGRRE